jgi:ubiquitin-conjugating enzyme E2 N
MASPRIIKEIDGLKKNIIEGISVTTDPNNFNHFFAILDGPGNTAYEGG